MFNLSITKKKFLLINITMYVIKLNLNLKIVLDCKLKNKTAWMLISIKLFINICNIKCKNIDKYKLF